jgi:hypothetical protein
MYSSQQCQYHTQTNALPSQHELNNWTQQRKRMLLNPDSTSNRYTALLEDVSGEQQHNTGPDNTPKPPPIYITDVKNY